MGISIDTLRVKSSITPAEVEFLARTAFQSGVAQGVQYLFDEDTFVNLVLYAIRHEVGGISGYNGFITNKGNAGGFAGVLQNGVDILIEGNAATKDSSYRKNRPTMWVIFPSGIHAMYTKSQRSTAMTFHKSLVTAPRNMIGTATDNLVSIVSYLDTARWAYAEVNKCAKRFPRIEEVYAFHLHGYVVMTNYYRLKNGLKPLTKSTLDGVTSTIRKQLSGQSTSARAALANVGTA